jgi:heme exporter protein C
MWKFFHELGSPREFYRISGSLLPWIWVPCLALLLLGSWQALVVAPPDYQQGESYRIMFVHVPSAWMSMLVYSTMAVCAIIGLVWRMKMAHIILISSVPIGASFTFLALFTGAFWGKPMWGAYWVWDARLTSELILLFLYVGITGLYTAFDDRRTAERAAAILVLVGSVNIPIIHYSVEWWNTLHQGPTVTKFDSPSIHPSMLWPLLIMAVAFTLLYCALVLMRSRNRILEQERRSQWVYKMVGAAL